MAKVRLVMGLCGSELTGNGSHRKRVRGGSDEFRAAFIYSLHLFEFTMRNSILCIFTLPVIIVKVK